MTNKIKVLGDEKDILFYNLNNDIVNFPKLIITKKQILEATKTESVYDLLIELDDKKNKTDLKKKVSEVNFLDTEFSKEFEDNLGSNLEFITKSFLNFELKNYSFSHFSNNLKFTMVIRTFDFTIRVYELEKGEILTNLKKLLSKYFKAIYKIKDITNYENFQVEIFENYEPYKSIFLKKENNNLILKSSFGYLKNEIFDYSIDDEFYFSLEENFNFFENSQTKSLVKSNTKLELKDIKVSDKIIENNELVKINEITKNFNDVLIEIIITSKNEIKIVNAQFISNFSNIGNENGFVIFKSLNNYNKISLVSIREVLEESVNPKYLLIRSETEFIELLNNLKSLNEVCGIIFNVNFYHLIFEDIGKNLNLDIIYYYKKLSKTLEATIDFEDFKINVGKFESPFENIISSKKVEDESSKDAWLNHLKDIDLNENPNQNKSLENNNEDSEKTNNNLKQEISNAENLTNSIFSSENSSFKKNLDKPSNDLNSSSSQGDTSSLNFLVQSALNTQQKVDESHSEIKNKMENIEQNNGVVDSVNESSKEEEKIEEVREEEALNENSCENQNTQNESFDLFEEESSYDNNNDNNTNNTNNSNDYNNDISYEENNKVSVEVSPNNTDISVDSLFEKIENNEKIETNDPLKKYLDVISIKLYTNLSINSKHYLLDLNSYKDFRKHDCEVLLLTNSFDRKYHNVTYLFFSVDEKNLEDGDSVIINSFDDFFKYHTQKEKKINYFINITRVDESSKNIFLKNSIERFTDIFVLLEMKDLKHIEEFYTNIKGLYIQDLNSQKEYEKISEDILKIEKKRLYALLEKNQL